MSKELQHMTQRYHEMEQMCLGYVKRLHDAEAINADLLRACEALLEWTYGARVDMERRPCQKCFTAPVYANKRYCQRCAWSIASDAVAKAKGEPAPTTERR